MSLLITADLHFSDNPRDEYRFGIIQQLLKLISKHQPKVLLILGDLTEKKDNHGAWLVNKIVQDLVMLASWCPIIILRGNHDGLDPTNPFFEFLGQFENISYITNPREMDLPGPGKCLLLPHTTNYRHDWSAINLKSKEYYYIFAHNTFKGATGQHRELDGLPTNIFRDDAKVIAGDVHIPHTVGPVTYVGSPYLVDFGDDFRPRVLLETYTSRKSIAVTGPQKRLVECTLGDEKTVWPREGLNEGDILKIRVAVTQKQYSRWQEIVREIRAWGQKHKYVIHAVQPVVSGGGRREDGLLVSRSRLVDEEILDQYGQQHGVESRVLKRGKKLMGESK